MIAGLALLAVIGVALPHAMRLDNVRPATAAILWLAALTLRALAAISVALFLVVAFPSTAASKVLTHWCVHSVLPVVDLQADIHGHAMGAAASITPGATIALALAAGLLGTVRATRAVSSTLLRRSLGAGPEGSVIVGGADVLIGAAGLLRPRVVVSAGALAALDDEELAAALAHERGHIARRHHVCLAYAEFCRAVAWMLPGTRRAVDELRFHLERDADEWALRRNHDPCALASAICKAAITPTSRHVAMVTLAGGAIERRVDELLGQKSTPDGTLRRRIVDSAAVFVVSITLALLVAIPTEALAGDHGRVADHSEHHCVR